MTPNKPDLVLHIGTEKTGTTTIQNFLKANRDQLRRQSVDVSKDLMIPSGNQRWLAALAYNATRIDELISTQGYRSKAERDQDMVNRYERLKQEIEASTSDCKRWIISSIQLPWICRRLRLRDIARLCTVKLKRLLGFTTNIHDFGNG